MIYQEDKDEETVKVLTELFFHTLLIYLFTIKCRHLILRKMCVFSTAKLLHKLHTQTHVQNISVIGSF